MHVIRDLSQFFFPWEALSESREEDEGFVPVSRQLTHLWFLFPELPPRGVGLGQLWVP